VADGDRNRVLRELRRSRIAVIGLGVSNQALLRFLLARGVRHVAAGDAKTQDSLGPAAGWLASLPITLRLGPGYLDILEDADIVFLTPGIRKHLPEITAARDRGARLSSEIGLLLELCRARTVGITGSAGKTTTTLLVGDMLARSGRKVFVGGNIGTPLIDRCLEFTADETIVLELSSFQLQLVDRSPNVAAVLNVSPNHLDVHRDYDDYLAAKKTIYRYQRPGDWVVLGADNAETFRMAQERAAAYRELGNDGSSGDDDGLLDGNGRPRDGGRGNLAPADGGPGLALFGKAEPPGSLAGTDVPYRAWVDGDHLVVTTAGSPAPVALCPTAGVRLRGNHNLLNIMAAALMTVLAGGRLDAASQVATTFQTVEHRLEPAGELDGVTFINDSIGTAPDRTEVALASFPAPIHLILGGYDKKIPFDGLGEIVVECGKVRRVVLLGETAPKIRRAIEAAASLAAGRGPNGRIPGPRGADPHSRDSSPHGPESPGPPPMVEVSSIEEAVREAFAGAEPGTTVLLSPACASFDMFPNYEVRGAAFKEAVRALMAKREPGA